MDARQAYDEFWDKTPAQIILIVNAMRKRDMRDHDDMRARNYELANLISFAHHQPKKIPEFKSSVVKEKPGSDEASQAKARGAMIAWALSNGASA